MLGTQYEITEIQGKGVFSSVVKARDIQNGEVVAIKIIRHNDTMYVRALLRANNM